MQKTVVDGGKVLAVGDPGLGIGELVSALSKSQTVKAVLTQRWKELARDLGVSISDRMELEADMMYKRKDGISVVEWILVAWRSRNASNATLDVLIKTVEALNMEDAASILSGFVVELT